MKRSRLYLLLPVLVLSLVFLVLGCYTQIRRVSSTDAQQEEYITEETETEEAREGNETVYNYNFYGCDYPDYWIYWNWDWCWPYCPPGRITVTYWDWYPYHYWGWYYPWIYRWHPYRYWDYYYYYYAGDYPYYYSGYYEGHYSPRPSIPYKQRDFTRREGIDRRMEETPHLTPVAKRSTGSPSATRMRKVASSPSSGTKVQTQPNRDRTRIRKIGLENLGDNETIQSTRRTTGKRPKLKPPQPTRVRKKSVNPGVQHKPQPTRRSKLTRRSKTKVPSYSPQPRRSSTPAVSSPARRSKSVSSSKQKSSTSKSNSSRTRKR